MGVKIHRKFSFPPKKQCFQNVHGLGIAAANCFCSSQYALCQKLHHDQQLQHCFVCTGLNVLVLCSLTVCFTAVIPKVFVLSLEIINHLEKSKIFRSVLFSRPIQAQELKSGVSLVSCSFVLSHCLSGPFSRPNAIFYQGRETDDLCFSSFFAFVLWSLEFREAKNTCSLAILCLVQQTNCCTKTTLPDNIDMFGICSFKLNFCLSFTPDEEIFIPICNGNVCAKCGLISSVLVLSVYHDHRSGTKHTTSHVEPHFFFCFLFSYDSVTVQPKHEDSKSRRSAMAREVHHQIVKKTLCDTCCMRETGESCGVESAAFPRKTNEYEYPPKHCHKPVLRFLFSLTSAQITKEKMLIFASKKERKAFVCVSKYPHRFSLWSCWIKKCTKLFV